MVNNKKVLAIAMLVFMAISILIPTQVSHAAALDELVGSLATSTMAASSGNNAADGGFFSNIFGLLFDKILGPIFNIFGGGKSDPSTPGKVNPFPDPGANQNLGSLKGKTIVVDPGHGGSNPGAVANDTREADNNLAVGLKVRDRLVQAGAKVVMTRSSDTTVAAEGSSLGEELQARLDMAQANNADLFVSVHSNSNPDTSIAGAMTFYPSDKSSDLALAVQNNIIKRTGAVDKGTSPATFYVLRNASMPSILVEMGFVTNTAEAARLQEDSYRNQMAQGIVEGLAAYFK